MKKIIPLLFVTGLLTGCATTGEVETEATMPNVPAKKKPTPAIAEAAGPVAVLATPEINKTMDDSDRRKLKQLVIAGTPQKTASWQNAKNVKYQFQSQDLFVNDKGQACRKFQFSSVTSGFLHQDQKQMTGTACRLDDGSWQLVHEE